MDERARRLGQNEALFRDVNERVRAVNDSFAVRTGTAEFLCECANTSCMDRVTLALADYERVRGEATWFIVKPGHEIDDVETVVEQNGAWNVVQKDAGEPSRVAQATDPRA